MLENKNGSLDKQFAADIKTIAESISILSRSVAVIAGIMARQHGVAFDIGFSGNSDDEGNPKTNQRQEMT